MECIHCGKAVKVNEIIRSAAHDLGCQRCYGTAQSPTAAQKRQPHRHSAIRAAVRGYRLPERAA